MDLAAPRHARDWAAQILQIKEGRTIMQNEALLRKVAAIAVPLILLAALIAVSMWGSEQAARAEGLTQIGRAHV